MLQLLKTDELNFSPRLFEEPSRRLGGLQGHSRSVETLLPSNAIISGVTSKETGDLIFFCPRSGPQHREGGGQPRQRHHETRGEAWFHSLGASRLHLRTSLTSRVVTLSSSGQLPEADAHPVQPHWAP